VTRQIAITVAAAIVLCVPPRTTLAARPHLDPAAKRVLTSYVSALRDRRYADAYRLLNASERAYFRTPGNYASIFLADELRIDSFTVVGSRDGGKLGVLGLVSEKVRFFDHAHQTHGSATATVPYGLVRDGDSWAVKDPFHPWKAVRTTGIEATVSGVRINVRKVSFFAGRVEVVLSFANVGDGFVTLLPYGRSVLRGDGVAFHPIATKVPALTDKRLYLGLRLASSAQYTGAVNFALPSPAQPTRLELTVAPLLRDGADAPFEVALPPITVPRTP
jgi:hypothetical protein